jgi:thiamine-monophosphate kinase
MGARPLGFLLTLGLPRNVSGRALDGFLAGLLACARAARCPLVGGDITRAGEFSAAITAIGAVTRGRALLRSAARPGDRVLVTGRLGGAAAGLRALERRKRLTRAERPLAERQRAPAPPFRAGPALVRLRLSRCAIDVSDGLLQDLGHVLEESRVGARIALEAVPVAPGATLDDALGGGEDYELLFTVSARAPSAAMIGKRLACRVTELGVITRQRRLVLTRAGRPVEAITRGYEHFKASSARSEE